MPHAIEPVANCNQFRFFLFCKLEHKIFGKSGTISPLSPIQRLCRNSIQFAFTPLSFVISVDPLRYPLLGIPAIILPDIYEGIRQECCCFRQIMQCYSTQGKRKGQGRWRKGQGSRDRGEGIGGEVKSRSRKDLLSILKGSRCCRCEERT